MLQRRRALQPPGESRLRLLGTLDRAKTPVRIPNKWPVGVSCAISLVND
jgi:hypothetical protein